MSRHRIYCALCEAPVDEDDPALDVMVDTTWRNRNVERGLVEEHRDICRDCATRVADALEESE